MYPLLKVGKMRQLIADLPDDAEIQMVYGDVHNKYIFARFDGWERKEGSVLLTLSLVNPDEEDEEDEIDRLPEAGTHCPDDGCPGVIEATSDRSCSHCGTDYYELTDSE